MLLCFFPSKYGCAGCVKTYDVLFRMNTHLAAILVFQRMPWLTSNHPPGGKGHSTALRSGYEDTEMHRFGESWAWIGRRMVLNPELSPENMSHNELESKQFLTEYPASFSTKFATKPRGHHGGCVMLDRCIATFCFCSWSLAQAGPLPHGMAS